MARVYVGTYGKYNAGSIAGKWIDLSSFENYDQFVKACAEVHKDERDPEFMIQDYEGMPDGLACGEWISREEFDDIRQAEAEEKEGEGEQEHAATAWQIVDYSEKAVAAVGDTKPMAEKFKELGGRFNPRLTCGAGWIFSRRKEDDLRALLARGATAAPAQTEDQKKKKGAGFVNSLDEYIETLKTDSDRAYYKKGTAAAIKFPEGYFIIEKPRIENRFCFSDEGSQYDLYCELHSDQKKMERYFRGKNLRGINEEIELFASDENIYISSTGYQGVADTVSAKNYSRYYAGIQRWREGSRLLTAEEKKTILAAYRSVRAAFEKRLDAYLKRYGVSKLHTWTYWANA